MSAPIGTIRQVEPFPIHERDTLVPSFYRDESGEQRDHDAHPDAIVTFEGIPISVNGETLTIGLMPPERRFAVQRTGQDGLTAEVYPQDVFANRHRMWWEQELLFKNSRPTDPTKWPVPHVRNFVAFKIRGHDQALWPLGMPCERELPKQSQQVYDAKADRMMSRQEWEQSVEDLKAKHDELEKTLEKRLANAKDRADTLAAVDAAKSFSAPCGATIKAEAYLPQHRRFCKQPECQKEGPDAL